MTATLAVSAPRLPHPARRTRMVGIFGKRFRGFLLLLQCVKRGWQMQQSR
jgi:hypothetical protein